MHVGCSALHRRNVTLTFRRASSRVQGGPRKQLTEVSKSHHNLLMRQAVNKCWSALEDLRPGQGPLFWWL